MMYEFKYGIHSKYDDWQTKIVDQYHADKRLWDLDMSIKNSTWFLGTNEILCISSNILSYSG